jgi:hypothetical protein
MGRAMDVLFLESCVLFDILCVNWIRYPVLYGWPTNLGVFLYMLAAGA